MNQSPMMIMIVRRKEVSPGSRWEDDTAYQLWIVYEVCPAVQELAGPGLVRMGALDTDVGERLNERLREAVAETAAAHVEGAIWKVWKTADDLSLVQTINFLGDVSDNLTAEVRGSLEHLAGAAGVPGPVSLAGADVAASLATKPVTKPIMDLAHGLEVIGIIVGLLTALHPLTMTCAKYLAHDKMGDALTSTLQKLMDEFTVAEARKETRVGDVREVDSETSTPAVPAGPEETTADDAADAKRLERAAEVSRGEQLEPSETLREAIRRYEEAVSREPVSREPVSQEAATMSHDATSAT